MPKVQCSLCGNAVEPRQMVAAQKLDNHTVELIKRDRPEWEGKRRVCHSCLEQYRAKKFLGYLEAEFAKISALEESLVSKLARCGRVAKLVNEEFDAQMTFGQRVADRVAHFGGSWTFIFLFVGIRSPGCSSCRSSSRAPGAGLQVGGRRLGFRVPGLRIWGL